jgi:hypothetical protein
MTVCLRRTAERLAALALAAVLGATASTSSALAQGASSGQAAQAGKAKPAHPASKSTSVPGVVVQPRPQPSKVPPDKKAALDAQAAKRKAWANYRTTTPTATAHGRGKPGSSPDPGNYPGLSNLGSR